MNEERNCKIILTVDLIVIFTILTWFMFTWIGLGNQAMEGLRLLI